MNFPVCQFNPKIKKKIGVSVSNPHSPHLVTLAKNLAKKINLPYLDELDNTFDFLLIVSSSHLSLKKLNSKFAPIYVDFLSGKQTYRRQHASLRTELLPRALGLKHHTKPIIIDVTAGLGQDSFILASLGFEIVMLERSPIIWALVQDGLDRALEDKQAASIVKRMQLVNVDAIHYLKKQPRADIIYLDPMFPERQKSARVKKEMEIFRELLGEDDDAENLLQLALACAAQRVVVKRPRLGSTLPGPVPSFNLLGRACRFDVYLKG